MHNCFRFVRSNCLDTVGKLKYCKYLDKHNPVDRQILKLVKKGELSIGFVLLGN